MVHCVKDTAGWRLKAEVETALAGAAKLEKPSFGSLELPKLIGALAGGEQPDIELIGLCTDICVVSNALILKACFPEARICVNPACCAGVTPETHAAALSTMACCQIDLI